MERLPPWITSLVARRWVWLMACALVTAAAGWGIRSLGFDASNEAYFVAGDPTLARYEQLQREFGSDELVYVLVEVEDAFAAETSRDLLALGEALRGLDLVERVDSPLHTAFSIDEGGLIVAKSVEEVGPQTPAALAEWRAKVLAHEPFRGVLISPDARWVGFLLTLDRRGLDSTTRVALSDELERLLAREPWGDYPSSAVGTAIQLVLSGRILAREALRAVVTGLIVAGVLLLLLFRSLLPSLAVLGVILATLLGTYGAMGHTGVPFSHTSTVLVTLVICVGLADSMHVVAAFERLRQEEPELLQALRLAIAAVWRPCLLTSLTTAAGFLSLLSSRIAPVSQLGAFASLACLLAYLNTFCLLPALLSLRRGPPLAASSDLAGRALASLGRLAVRRSGRIVAPSLLAFVVAVAGLTHLYAEENTLTNLSPDEPLRQRLEFVQARMGGVNNVEIVVRPLRPDDDEAQAEVLRRSGEFERWLEALHPAIRSVRGIADGIEEVHVLFEGPRQVPEDPAATAQLLLTLQMADPDFHDRHLTLDGSALRIAARVDVMGSRTYQRLLSEIQRELDQRFEGLAEGYVTGGAMLIVRAVDYILETQVESFLLALGVVTLLVMLGAGDVRLGLLSVVPNLFPVLFVLGLMGWCDISLSISNAMIATVAIGIVVDDTIHIVASLRRALGRGQSVEEAIGGTLQRSGRAVLFTSLVLVACCFCVWLTSELLEVREFGLLAGLTFAIALLADLALLPALLALWARR